MVRENQILVQADDNYFVCLPCGERSFSSEEHLYQHCRTAKQHQGKWCDPHQWLFVSTDALRAHKHDASDHWVCGLCNADEDTEKDLIGHMGNKHSRCYDCSSNVGNFHKHRVDEHSRCDSCGKEFEDDNERDMHSQVHLPRSKDCFGCQQMFKSYSGILLHLETGTCASGITEDDIDKCIPTSYLSSHYTNGRGADYLYRCPVCELDMARISSLLQHVETKACDANYSNRPLKALLETIQRCVREVL